jgi:glycosyltransferase involved in cell wall biosynthesis
MSRDDDEHAVGGGRDFLWGAHLITSGSSPAAQGHGFQSILASSRPDFPRDAIPDATNRTVYRRCSMSPPRVSLAIPGRNCRSTIGACLDAVVPILSDERLALAQILFVDDASTDDTRDIVARYPARNVSGPAAGRGAARNVGWRSASGELVWFVDSDCVTEPDALLHPLARMQDPGVGGVSGSYGNMNPDSLLACLIHEEIIERHRRMPPEVGFLATFNVLYRRSVLEQVGALRDAREVEFVDPAKAGHYRLAAWRG